MMNRRISTGLAAVCAVLGLLLSGCTLVSSQRSAPTTSPSSTTKAASKAPCLGPIFYPGLDVTELNQSLPIAGVTESYVQYELGVRRGNGLCVDQDLSSKIMNACHPVDGDQSSVVGQMLGATPEDITNVEFARGASKTLTEMGTGHTQSNSSFQYRLSAWHFASSNAAKNSVVTSIVESCLGAKVDDSVIHVDIEGVPRIVAFRSGQDVFLVENMQALSSQDVTPILLSPAAMITVEMWWKAHAASYFATGRVAPSNAT